jgi:hypothetical protein
VFRVSKKRKDSRKILGKQAMTQMRRCAPQIGNRRNNKGDQEIPVLSVALQHSPEHLSLGVCPRLSVSEAG